MAVSITRTADPAGVGGSTATYTNQSIGTAADDRLVVVAVTMEANLTINSTTIDGVAMLAGPSAVLH